MDFSVLIWGSVSACVVILIPLFTIYYVFDWLRFLLQMTDKE